MSEYFISGRDVPWWLAGTCMVATTFGADTPLVVTGIVYRYGIAGNWLWWTMALSGMMTVFFFARLWRRAGVLTDMEFAELRYAGRPAAFLRGFRALYLALPVNTIIMGWVNLAMAKILELTLGVKRLSAVMFCLGMTVLYTAISGLWAVLWTDLLQFVLKMGMVIVLAIFAVRAVGGIHGLTARLAAHDATTGSQSLAFVPDWTSGWFLMFLVYLSVNWWASWYPGAEPGGGGYIAQRIFSAKNEKHSLAATLWFNLAHYALRPWPWILTALVAVVLYPNLRDPEVGYIQVMIRHLPASLRGLMLAGFAAAYMSTIGTHINLGASYLINDFYRRFVKRDAGERHYVRASRLATIVVTLLAAIATYFMSSIEVAWKFLISIGAGAGLVFMLRWFWWRINAWSEISAMSAAGISSLLLQSRAATGLVEHLRSIDPRLPAGPLNASDPHGFAWLMILTTACTTVTWLVVTFMTPPEPAAKLREFYQRVRPGSGGMARRYWFRATAGATKPAVVRRRLDRRLRPHLRFAVRHRLHHLRTRRDGNRLAGHRRRLRRVHLLGPRPPWLGCAERGEVKRSGFTIVKAAPMPRLLVRRRFRNNYREPRALFAAKLCPAATRLPRVAA